MFKSIVTKKHYNNLLIIGSFIILSIMSVCLLFHTHILLGASDMQFHMRRIAELRASFIHGNFFPRFALNEFHGSSVMAMYPYVNLIPIVLVSFIIKNSIELIYICFIIHIFLSFIISYYSSLQCNSNKLIDYLFSIFYCFSTFYLDYGFFNMDLGMLSMITVLPLVIFGFIEILNKSNKWFDLSLGMTLIVFSHVLSVLILSVFLLSLLIINYRIVTKRVIINLIKAASLTIITTSIFWIPFVNIMLNNSSNMNRPGGSNLYGTSFNTLFLGAIRNEGTYSISFFAIIGFILCILFFKQLTNIEKQMFILSIFIIVICSNIFPWHITMIGPFRLLRGFQFTWRFYVIPQIFLCYIASICITRLLNYCSNNYIELFSLICIIFIVVLCQFMGQNNIINNNIDSKPFTKKFINMNSINYAMNIHHKMAHIYTLDIPHPKSIKRPESYKVSNQSQFNNLISPYNNESLIDYYPMKAIPKLNSIINNHIIVSNSNKYIKMKYLNYNHFQFYSDRTLKLVYLPLVRYNSENLNINLNGKAIKDYSNKYNLIMLKHIKKGNNNIRINVVSNKFGLISELMLLILGILIYCYKFIIRYKDL